MPHTHRIIFLLLCVVSSTIPNSDIKTSPSDNSENPEKTIENKDINKTFHQKKNPKIFTEQEIAEMESVFKNSPKKAQHIVDYLENPTHFSDNEDHRLAIFFGDSESDSKDMAEVIAYKMYKQGWNIKFFSSNSFFGKNSDHTAIKLANALNSIETSDEPTMLVFDDLNQLLGYNHNQYNDSHSRDTSLFGLSDRKTIIIPS